MGNQQSSTGGTPSSPGRSTPGHASPNHPDGSNVSQLGSGVNINNASLSASAHNTSSSRPLAGGVSSLFGGGRDRSGSTSSTIGRSKSNSVSLPSPPTPPGLVDGGHLHPQGLYSLRPAAQDYSHPVVKGLIIEKKLAPFYRGLEDYEEDWTDDQVLLGLREVRQAQALQAEQEAADELANAAGTNMTIPTGPASHSNTASGSGTGSGVGASAAGSIRKGLKIAVGGKEKREEKERTADRERKESRAYKGAVECPICFLYYPPNINTSRCCEQPICTECFVQIKRAEATITHLESEPAACPYCMETDFGVIYEVQNIARPETLMATSPSSSEIVIDPRADGQTPRRKSVSSKSKAVVTIDQIRPDWEDKLNAVKAQAARRASRRIIMHRVGDRLIPVGYTSSRNSMAGTETGPITTEMSQEAFQQFMSAASGVRGARSGSTSSALGAGSGGGRRSSRRGEREGVNDLEEMMLMEAMRLSMLEHEEQQKKEAEAKKKAQQESGSAGESSSDPSGFLQPRPASNTSSAASSMRNVGSVPGLQPGSSLGHAPYTLAQPAESSPLSGTPITRSEVDVSRGGQPQRPDLINLDSDAAIVPTTQRSTR